MIPRTKRLVLRRAVWKDLAAVHRLFSDPAVMRYWSRPEHATLEETRHGLAFLVDPAADSLDFLVEKDSGVIGKAGPGHCRRSGSCCTRTIGVRGWPMRRWTR